MNMNNFGGCFSPYMMISSVLQTVFSTERRNIQDDALGLNQEFQLAIRDAKEKYQDELETTKQMLLQKKLEIGKEYRAKEKFKSLELKYASQEIKMFFEKCLPIDTTAIPVLEDEAREYMNKNFSSECPINVVMLHTLQSEICYSDIIDNLENTESELGNVVYQRWCNKDVAHNSAILNLYAIMANIPTLVISPYFQGGKIHFNVAMWEAQTNVKPMIRPLFSIDCNRKFLKQDEGKADMTKRMAYISTIISGCARDSYMLFSFGHEPTLPVFLKKKENLPLLKFIQQEDNTEIRQFIISEYNSAAKLLQTNECKSQLLEANEIEILQKTAQTACEDVNKLLNQKLVH